MENRTHKVQVLQALSRREFIIQASTVAAGSTLLASCVSEPAIGQESTSPTNTSQGFHLAPLGYEYNALEPHIDAQTMELHYSKHHAAAVKSLNEALTGHQFAALPIEELLTRLNDVPEDKRTAVRNNGGSHANHTMFWENMAPGGKKEPDGDLEGAIKAAFGSFDAFKTSFNDTGAKHFGSGWVWLILDKGGKLAVTSTPNQDNPLMEGSTPLLGNDVWEHAYYLRYQNRRSDYLKAWWNTVNWDVIAKRYSEAKKP